MSSAVATKSEVTQAVVGKVSLMARIADRYAVDPDKMKATLIATAFRQRAKDGKSGAISDEQLMMLLIVADQYTLNPFTREIYAFPSEGGIVPIVSIDGWIRIINERSELKSISFEMAPAGTEDPWISCTIERHDRARPVTITEYLSECSRNTDPWKDMPRRMLRHKALIQCARVAFGFAGIFDPDDGDKIVSVVDQVRPAITGKPKTEKPQARVKQDPPASKGTDDLITPGDVVRLEDKANAEGIPLNAVCAKFEVGALRELKASQVDAAIAFIDDVNAPE